MTQLPLPAVLAQAGPLDVSLLFVGERWFILGWQMPQRGPSATGR